MKEVTIYSFFVIGIFSTDILINNMLDALFCVGKSKSKVRKIKKEFSLFQRYCSKHVKLPLEYNAKTARFFKTLRVINLFILIGMALLFIFLAKGKETQWFTILVYIKVLTIDLFVLLYSWKHSGKKFFSADMEPYDFTKKK